MLCFVLINSVILNLFMCLDQDENFKVKVRDVILFRSPLLLSHPVFINLHAACPVADSSVCQVRHEKSVVTEKLTTKKPNANEAALCVRLAVKLSSNPIPLAVTQGTTSQSSVFKQQTFYIKKEDIFCLCVYLSISSSKQKPTNKKPTNEKGRVSRKG